MTAAVLSILRAISVTGTPSAANFRASLRFSRYRFSASLCGFLPPAHSEQKLACPAFGFRCFDRM
jgi:hypothetical protein